MINVLFAAHPSRWPHYEIPLRRAFTAAGLTVNVQTDLPPEQTDYIIYAPNAALQDFTPYTKLKAVLNLWAGVEEVIGNETLKAPLCRMVEEGLTEGMVEWVTGHVLRHHLGMDAHIHGQDGQWRGGIVPPLARDRKVSILGMGELGSACAKMLKNLNFDVQGWSRSPKDIPGIPTHFGPQGLRAALAHGQITVLLLPAASSLDGFLGADAFAQMPKGAVIINPGRGVLLNDEALIRALNGGRLSHATLDVFRTEPLPKEHPFWTHPQITVTPHIASQTRPETAAQVIAENIKNHLEGRPLRHLVDRDDR